MVLLISLLFTLTGCGFFNQPPEAKFTVTSHEITDDFIIGVSEKIEVDASASVPHGGEITEFKWNFKNNKDTEDPTRSGKVAEYIYESEGTYEVALTVTNSAGLTDTETLEVEVKGLTPPEPPPG